MTKLHCPICDRLFSENDDGVAMPFCSARCKLIDAGRWLGEAYGLPLEIDEEEQQQRDGDVSPRVDWN